MSGPGVRLRRNTQAVFISYFLRPEFAYLDVEFKNLNPSKFTFDSFELRECRTKYRASLESRVVRIAFESLALYVSKGLKSRKLVKLDEGRFVSEKNNILQAVRKSVSTFSATWEAALNNKQSSQLKEAAIKRLLGDEYQGKRNAFSRLQKLAEQHFKGIGQVVAKDFEGGH